MRRQPKKPTSPYGDLAFSKDGRVRKRVYRLSDEKPLQERAAIQQFAAQLEKCYDMGPIGIEQLPERDQDFVLTVGGRPVLVQLTEIVQRHYVRVLTQAELRSRLHGGGDTHFLVDESNRPLLIDIDAKDRALRDRIAKKAKKYPPDKLPLWLVVFTVDTYTLEYVRGGTLFMTPALQLARNHIRGAKSFLFDEVWFTDLRTAPVKIWPAPEAQPPVADHA
jgi:hypothetical protein